MKILIFLLTISFSASACGARDNAKDKEVLMKKKDIIQWVNDNNVKRVKACLEKGVDVNTQDQNGRNLLLLATINNQNEMAELLVENGADVNMQADNKDSPFLLAGARGYTELVRLYLENGARFDVFNRYHGSALIPACERGHVETVRLLVNTKDYPIDHVNNLGWTALMEAVVLGDGSKNYQEIVQILKEGGANMEIPDKNGVTALEHARARGFDKIVEILSE